MLRHTFIHLPGVGIRRERAIWEQGILDWEQWLAAYERGLTPGKWCQSAVPLIRQSVDALAQGDPRFFGSMIPSGESWRLFREFADRAVFLDIETTGLSASMHEVTVIGALGGGELAVFVKGFNLEEFPRFVERFPLLVTYNGSQFDVPFLKVHFPQARLDQAHIDLRFVMASLGYKGGLKAVERHLGLDRDASIQGIDGFEAVRLWYRYQRGDRAALETLIRYTLADVANLVPLAEIAVAMKCQRLQFPGQIATPPNLQTMRLDDQSIASWTARRFGALG